MNHSRITFLRSTVIAVVLIALSVASCSQPGPSFGTSSRSWTWEMASDDAVSGIHSANVELVTLTGPLFGEQNKLSFALWTDITNSSTSSSSTPQLARFNALLKREAAEPVEISCIVDGQRPPHITIDGREYQLSNHDLILVSGRGERPIVKQINFSIDSIPDTAEKLQQFALETSEIRSFFESQSGTTTLSDEADSNPSSPAPQSIDQ